MHKGLTENEEVVRKVLRKCIFIETYIFLKSLCFKEIVVLLSEMTKMLKNEGMKQGEFTEN